MDQNCPTARTETNQERDLKEAKYGQLYTKKSRQLMKHQESWENLDHHHEHVAQHQRGVPPIMMQCVGYYLFMNLLWWADYSGTLSFSIKMRHDISFAFSYFQDFYLDFRGWNWHKWNRNGTKRSITGSKAMLIVKKNMWIP